MFIYIALKGTRGERIQQARKHRKMTQAEVARKMGVSRAAVGQWEINATKPDLDDMKKLASLLGFSASWLSWCEGRPIASTRSKAEVASVSATGIPEGFAALVPVSSLRLAS